METPNKHLLTDSRFSPVSVSVSPVVKVKGNLTGIVRKIRDNAADLHNLSNKWIDLYLQGVSLIQDIVKIKLLAFSKNGDKYPKELVKKCEEFDELFKEFEYVVACMVCIREYFKGICKLEEVRRSSSEPLFLTWPTTKFVKETAIITAAYEYELKTKEYVKDYICHARNEDHLLTFPPLWNEQCFVDDFTDFRIVAMLKECGHR